MSSDSNVWIFKKRKKSKKVSEEEEEAESRRDKWKGWREGEREKKAGMNRGRASGLCDERPGL